jgi:hypothetical protein
MMYIHYGDTMIMTSDAAANVVMDFAEALGKEKGAASVGVPSVDADGATIVTRILIGPASQIVLVPAPDDELEPETDQFVQDLRGRIHELGAA